MPNKIDTYSHLHVHSSFSLLDGYGLPDAIAKKASEIGYSSLAITDHATVSGLIKHQRACDKYGVVPIFGCEFYIVPNAEIKEKGERRGHITAWAKNETGYQNMLKMLTLANINYFYHRPRIDFNTLLSHANGLCIGTACSASFVHLDGGIDFFQELNNLIGEDLYCELMPFDYDGQIETSNLILDLSEKYNRKIIATNDCHYINADGDAETHEILLACQTKKKWSDATRWRFSCDGLYLCEPEFMVERFKKQGVLTDSEISNSLLNTMEIAKKCEGFRIKKKDISLPTPPQYVGRNEEEVFKELINSGFKKRFGLDLCL